MTTAPTDFWNIISSSLTKDNITLAIAILGAFGTLSAYFRQRLKLKVTFLEIRRFGSFYLKIEIKNCSSIPVSITQIRLKLGKKEFSLSRDAYIVIPKNPNAIGSGNPHLEQDTLSFQFPIRLEAFEAQSGYIQFPNEVQILASSTEENPSSPVTLLIVTTRGLRSLSIVGVVVVLNAPHEENK